MLKRTVLAVVFFLFLSFAAGASMISFCVVETGVPLDVNERRQSLFWENAFMDVFFDAGYIISNAPILRLEGIPSGEIIGEFDLMDFRRAGIDFIIIARLDYNADLALSDVSFFIYKVTPENKIHERQLDKQPSRNERDEYTFMKTTARGLIRYID